MPKVTGEQVPRMAREHAPKTVSDPGLAHLRLAGLLKRAQALLVEPSGRALARHGIDGRELAVLNVLVEQGPLSQQHISRLLAIDRTTVVALVDALETKDLVGRRPDPSDRRKNLVNLTEDGRKIHRQARPAVDEVEQTFLAPLSESERKALRRLLITVITAAETR
jgi:DNA-binding MarR family transcriptional regulator